ncbi:hypothetical protein EVAR_90856_1 [Eumeta japonica]|uniref:Uncharacterized protein n=1 Tax=Eumeta variegata TaxID=151549 RepID=A0A4C1ZR56_EUMVA|nr:hypothetical protein EVAR_90849_1 [Eumeta japonica]GBP91381.1 hypothetical protein EVAR_90856_1 [Eumeta japonica]
MSMSTATWRGSRKYVCHQAAPEPELFHRAEREQDRQWKKPANRRSPGSQTHNARALTSCNGKNKIMRIPK